MFTKVVTQAGHTRRFTITEGARLGWEMRVEEDNRVVRHVCYNDWHRVEQALNAIAQQVERLEQGGWRESAAPG